LSGAAGLGYQIIWTRSFATGLGHEMPALLAVLAAFMAGMALGAWRISSLRIVNAGRWYGWLEIAIGGWAFVTAALIPATNRVALAWIGLDPSPFRHWLVAFVIPFLALLPATAAMGATLPVIERFLTPLTFLRRSLGALYAANTLGAAVGVLCAAFALLPSLGLKRTTLVLGVANLCCGLVALMFSRRLPSVDETPAQEPEPGSTYRALFVTGLLGIGFEVIGVRVLAQVLENTIYTYAAILTVFLLGTSLGAALYHRLRWRPQLADLLSATGLACVIGIVAIAGADKFYQVLRGQLGDSVGGVLVSEMCVATVVFWLPAMTMGAAFTHLAQSMARTRRGLGRALAANTIGAALAPVLFSVLLLPWLGSKWTLGIMAAGYLITAFNVRSWRLAPWIALALALAFLPAALRFVTVPVGGRLLDYREGAMASVAVVEDATAHRSLRVDNRFQMGGTGVAEAEWRHAHIPLLLHPAPKNALFLGLGTGITFGAAALHTNVVADGVELLPEVARMFHWFEPFNDGIASPRLRAHVADARRFVRSATNSYDVIIGDLFHPARDGAGSLYTVEHFESIRNRLASGGLFCQWLPLHQLSDDMVRVITRSFMTVFPDTQAWLLRFNVEAPVIGLVGRASPIVYSSDWLERRAESPLLSERLQRLALGDSIRFFGNLLAGPEELKAFSGVAGANTDDNSAVLFGAPRFAYRNDASPYGRLANFLAFATPALAFDSTNLTQFVAARNVFVLGLIDEAEGRGEEAARRYVESARISEDFTAGYARAITMAAAEARSNPKQSRWLLEELVRARPSRPVAKQLLEKLFSASDRQPSP
jgi:spermidine synthase